MGFIDENREIPILINIRNILQNKLELMDNRDDDLLALFQQRL